MSRDREAWNPRDRHYRRGYRLGATQAGSPPRRGCQLLALSLLALVAGLTLVVGSAGGVLLTWWAG